MQRAPNLGALLLLWAEYLCLPNSQIPILKSYPPQWDGTRKWDLWMVLETKWGHEGGTQWWDWCLIRVTGELTSCLPPHHVKTRWGVGSLQPGRGFSQEPHHASTPILDLKPPEPQEVSFFCLSATSLWYVVTSIPTRPRFGGTTIFLLSINTHFSKIPQMVPHLWTHPVTLKSIYWVLSVSLGCKDTRNLRYGRECEQFGWWCSQRLFLSPLVRCLHLPSEQKLKTQTHAFLDSLTAKIGLWTS